MQVTRREGDAGDALSNKRFATVVLSTVCPHRDVDIVDFFTRTSRSSECCDDAAE
jgi:hypothetical protein